MRINAREGKRLHGIYVSLTKTWYVSFINVFGMHILQKPAVPLSPETLKLTAVSLY